MVDQLDHLVILDPPMRVKHHREHALLQHNRIQRRLPIADGDRIVRLVVMIRLPIARSDARKLPAELPDHVGVGIILNGINERAVGGNILEKFVLAVRVDY